MKARILSILTPIVALALLILVMAMVGQGTKAKGRDQVLPNMVLTDHTVNLTQDPQNSTNLGYTSEIEFTTAFITYLPTVFKNLCIDTGTPPIKVPYEYPDWMPADKYDYSLDAYNEYSKTIHCTEVVVAIHKDWDNISSYLAPDATGEMFEWPAPTQEEFASFVFDTFLHHYNVFQGYPYERYVVKVLLELYQST